MSLSLELPTNVAADPQFRKLLNDRLRRVAEEIDRLSGARGPVKLLDDLDMDGHRVRGLADPVDAKDAISRGAGDKRYLTGAAPAAGTVKASASTPKKAEATSRRQLELSAPGKLGIGSSLAPLTELDETRTASGLVALLKQAPTGADLRAVINVGGVVWARITIKDGETAATIASGLGAIAADKLVTLDLVGVGRTFPGADLTVLIRFA